VIAANALRDSRAINLLPARSNGAGPLGHLTPRRESDGERIGRRAAPNGQPRIALISTAALVIAAWPLGRSKTSQAKRKRRSRKRRRRHPRGQPRSPNRVSCRSSQDTCTDNPQDAGTKTVTNAVVPDSDPITFNNAGDFYWQAVYSGDANNEGITSECTSEHLVVNKASPRSRRHCPPPTWTSAPRCMTRRR
jgi:hypothetical protein